MSMASAGIQYFLSSGDCLSFGCVFILLLAKILIAFFFHRCTQSRLVCVIQKKKTCMCNWTLNPKQQQHNSNNCNNVLQGSCWAWAPSSWWVDDFSCKVTLTQWIRNQVTGSGFIRWLQPSWQSARWAGHTNGHWFFNKGPEAVSQPGHGDIFSHGAGPSLDQGLTGTRPQATTSAFFALHTLTPANAPPPGVNNQNQSYPKLRCKQVA